MATYKLLTNDEIEDVLKLQTQNLKHNLSDNEKASQGFLTISHEKEVLKKMNNKVPGVVAIEGDKVAGFCLSMSREFQNSIPILVPMFELFGTLEINGRELDSINYITVGQVCVAEPYRGKGIFKGLYNAFRTLHQSDYGLTVTEIAARNTRSMAAHANVGFKFLHQYVSPDGEVWNIVFWDWE